MNQIDVTLDLVQDVGISNNNAQDQGSLLLLKYVKDRHNLFHSDSRLLSSKRASTSFRSCSIEYLGQRLRL
jgi:hypothetical protein